jgi:tetratricopeptide (TPR) repeat protein
MISLMKRLYIIISIAVLIILGVIFAVRTGSYVAESTHFTPAAGERIADFAPVITVPADRERAYAQIRDMDKNTDVEQYLRLLASAQNYALLGEGRKSYNTLLEAIELNPSKSTAFNMLGNVLVQMGNLSSARMSFERAVEKESELFTNHVALASFLRQYFPDDKEAIKRAYEYGIEKNIGNLNILKEQASWLEETGDIAGAIEVWRKVYELGGKSPAVAERIKALERKQ